VVTPDSFKHLPEYGGDEKGTKSKNTGRIALADEMSAHDPNTVLLSRFNEWEGPDMIPPVSSDFTSIPTSMKVCRWGLVPSQLDSRLLCHFREVVWRQLVPIESELESSLARLDEAIPQFPPVSEVSWSMENADAK
jgi:hypothetical protein